VSDRHGTAGRLIEGDRVADLERPTARVEDATLVPAGGPARLALARVPKAEAIAEAVAAARGVSSWVEGRLVVTAVPARLIDAAGRVGGARLAGLVGGVVEPAVAAWLGAPPDLDTPAGTLPTSRRPVVVGVLNVTPDSFSDGGEHLDDHPDSAVAAGRALAAAGADVIDVGGESTRPGATPVDAEEERRRVLPVVQALAGDGLVVSIDTCKADVARAAVDAGAALVNDVTAGSLDDAMLPTVAELGVPYVVTHLRGTPATMQQHADYADVVGEVFDHLADRVAALGDLGVPAERLVVDPGIGFAKTAGHNLTLLQRLREFTSLGRPVMIGTSRKSFLGTLTGDDDPAERLEGSLATAALAVAAGARLVRVHDVAATAKVVRVAHAVTSGRLPDDDG
jgi:dihydropteroate synthase